MVGLMHRYAKIPDEDENELIAARKNAKPSRLPSVPWHYNKGKVPEGKA
jgi:hypothetical protein